MTILLPTLAVSFAAFCIWLTVRIINRRERWAKWAAVGVVLLAYPLSYGPTYRLNYTGLVPGGAQGPVFYFYLPLDWLDEWLDYFERHSNPPRDGPIKRYAALWIEDLQLEQLRELRRMKSATSIVEENIPEDLEQVDVTIENQ